MKRYYKVLCKRGRTVWEQTILAFDYEDAMDRAHAMAADIVLEVVVLNTGERMLATKKHIELPPVYELQLK